MGNLERSQLGMDKGTTELPSRQVNFSLDDTFCILVFKHILIKATSTEMKMFSLTASKATTTTKKRVLRARTLSYS